MDLHGEPVSLLIADFDACKLNTHAVAEIFRNQAGLPALLTTDRGADPGTDAERQTLWPMQQISFVEKTVSQGGTRETCAYPAEPA